MEKINFKNKGEAGAIPINSTNLNLLQNNVENSFKTIPTTSDKDTYSCNYINNLKGDILYSSGGSKDSFNLTISAEGYKYVEIFFFADGVHQSVKYAYSSSRKFSTLISYTEEENHRHYIYVSTWNINKTAVTRVSSRNNYINSDSTVASFGSNAYVSIYLVIGYK